MAHFKSYTSSHSVLGRLHVVSNENGITDILFDDPSSIHKSLDLTIHSNRCIDQLEEYIAVSRKQFELSLLPKGTLFQLRVWQALTQIPYGVTKTYLDIALMLGSRTLSRAVGQACNKNPIPIVIPCHRVIGSNGELIGYRGGVERKAWLLAFEKNNVIAENNISQFCSERSSGCG